LNFEQKMARKLEFWRKTRNCDFGFKIWNWNTYAKN
jgi:hypothetical protein